MKLETLGKRVIVRAEMGDKVSEGGIIIPTESVDVPLVGEVVVVSKDCTLLSVGDRVIYGRYSGFTIPALKDEWKGCLLMNEGDVLVKITGG